MNVVVKALWGLLLAESFDASILCPQSPHSEISLGVVPSVVDMVLLDRQVRRKNQKTNK